MLGLLRTRVNNVVDFVISTSILFLGLRRSGEECFTPPGAEVGWTEQHSVLAGALPLFEIPDVSVWLEG